MAETYTTMRFLKNLVFLLGPMAAISNTFKTSDAEGIREDLTDVIYNISPEDTPYMSSIGRGSADQTFHEWQEDSLEAPVSTNRVGEGDDVTSFAAITPTVRLGTHLQISRKELIISGTEQKVKKAGRSDELGYQVAKRGSEMKRDMEKMLLENIADDGNDPRATAGLGAWIKTNVDKEEGGVNPVYTNVPNNARTDGTPRAFTVDMLKNVCALVWDQGGTLKRLLVGTFNKGVASGFAGVATKTWNMNGAKPATTVAAVDVFVSDFGNLSIIPTRFQRGRDAWLVDPEFSSLVYLRKFQVEKLAKTGDAEKRMLIAEYGHKVHTEKAHGLVADLTTS